MSTIKLYIESLDETFILNSKINSWEKLVEYTEQKVKKALLSPEFSFKIVHQGKLHKQTFSGELPFEAFMRTVQSVTLEESVKITLVEQFDQSSCLQNSQFEIIKSERCEQQQQEYHPNVECDNCKQCPIQGIRYKCYVCKNFDVCQNCHNQHSQHPLIEIYPHQGVFMTNRLVQKMKGAYSVIEHQFEPSLVKQRLSRAKNTLIKVKEPFVKASQKVDQFFGERKRSKQMKVKLQYLEQNLEDNLQQKVNYKEIILQNPQMSKEELLDLVLNMEK